MRHLSYIIIILLITPITQFAQAINNKDGVVNTPSGAAMSFAKYADIPVNHFTGTANISVPITTVSDGPLSHPISLEYHSAGIRVSEVSSDVGLGWHLNAGGAITRTIQSLPDDETNGYYHDGDILSLLSHDDEVADGTRDGEPDIYAFNVNGMTGKFFFDENQNIQFLPKSEVAIEVELDGSDEFKGFTLIATDGTKYYFGFSPDDSDLVAEGSKYGNGSYYTTAWFLRKIESFDGKHEVNFSYVAQTYKYPVLPYCYKTYTVDGGTLTNLTNECPSSTQYTSIATYILDEITTTQQTITFSHFERQDLTYVSLFDKQKAIDKIEVENGNFCIEYDLVHTYFEDPDKSGWEGKRLKLDEVKKKACNSSLSEPSWTFTYYGHTNPNGTMFFPKYESKDIDHWGFYNYHTFYGHNVDDDIIPYTSVTTLHGGTPNYGSANRRPREDAMKKGMLKRVTYPTGGYTEMEYEANEYFDPTSTLTNEFYLLSCTSYCGGVKSDDITITMTDDMLDDGYIELCIIPDDDEYPNGGFDSTDNYAKVLIYDDQNVLFWSRSFNSSVFECSTWDLDAVAKLGFPVRYLEDGEDYKFKVESKNARATLALSYYTGGVNRTCGGLRITKATTHDDMDAANNIIKTFNYDHKTIANRSSGKIMTNPQYGFAINDYTALFASTSVLPMSSFSGYHIMYEYVTVDYNGNGEMTMEFNTEDATDVYDDYPITPVKLNVESGTLKEQKTWNESGIALATTTTTRYTSDTYSNINSTMFKSQKIKVKTSSGTPEAYFSKLYTPRTSIYRPGTVTTTVDGVSTVTTYGYQILSHPLLSPKTVKMTNSDDKETETTTYYTYDYPTTGNLQYHLRDRNMIGIPYKTEIEVDGTQLDGNDTEFAFWDTNGNHKTSASSSYFPRPYKLKRYERTWTNGTLQSGSWDTKKTIDSYNGDGLVDQTTMDGWTISNYITYTDKLVTRKSFSNQVKDYEYHTGSSLLKEVTNPDGTTSSYAYDDLMRLDSAIVDCEDIETTYEYYFASTGGSGNYNYVKTKVDYPTPTSLSDLDVVETYSYKDGLGRDIQTNRKAQAPNGTSDIITSVAYDKHGRISRNYEAQQSSNSGNFLTINTSWDHTLTEYEASPLNRVIKVTPPDWYATEFSYDGNSASTVKIGGGVSYYDADELIKKTVKDGNGNKTITYTDKKGRVVLVRRTDENETSSKNLDTYTIYDDKGRVTEVLPPGATTSTTELIYTYEYDAEDHVTEKKVPGQEEVLFKYNDKDLLMAYQDAHMGTDWYTYTYDLIGRELKSGFFNDTNPTNADHAPDEVLTENIYGTTGIEKDKIKTVKTKVLGTSDWLETTNSYTTCGRLSSQSGNNHINTTAGQTTASFTYDGAGNVVRTNSSINAHSVTETIQSTSDLDHTGRVIYDYFKVGTGIDKIISKNVYNHKEQLITVYQGKTDNGQTGNKEYGQKIDYSYLTNGLLWKINGDNLTGTKTAISSCSALSPGDPSTTHYDNKDLFYSILHYDTGLQAAADQKNGNIANVEWQIRGRYAQMYAYNYDDYNRLTSADYYDKTSGGSWSNSNIYDTRYTYDDRGNITDLERWGKITSGSCYTNGKIDDMSYTYTSNTNELKKVDDISNATHGFKDGSGAATSYTYDDNGNMITDDHKDIDTEFNHLDLPTQIISNGDTIFFTYDANGTMLQKIQSDNGDSTTIDYISGIEYKDGSIDAVYFGTGRVNYEGGSERYEYYISDHLGNNRLMYSDLDSNGIISTPSEIIEELHYYPFGLAMDGPWMNSSLMKYTYNDD